MIQATNPDINVEDLMRSIHQEIALRRTDSALLGNRTFRPGPVSGLSSINPQIEMIQLPRFDATSSNFVAKKSFKLSEFLDFHDETFIRNAYRGILNREPDSNGMTYYLTALRSGRYSKAEIIGRLRYSSEGRAYGVRIKGLFLPFAFQIAYRFPVLGYIFAWANFLLRLPSIVRNWSRFEAFVESQHYEQTQRFNQFAEQVEHRLSALYQQTIEHDRYHSQQLEKASEEVKRYIQNILLEQQPQKDELASLRAMLESKAELNEIVVLRNELAAKADVERLANMESNILNLRKITEDLVQKIRPESMAEWINNLQQSMADKANQTDLENIQSQLNAKADATLLEDWNTHLAKKAETEHFSSLDKRLIAFSEQTNLALSDIQRQAIDLKRNIIDQQRRLTLLLEEARKRLPEPITYEQIENISAEEDHLLDAFYVGFEDCFRGTREDIKQRMKVYLPIIQEAKAGDERTPILDVGCGRGEWLELLDEIGLTAYGIDLNRVMVHQCQELGLKVVETEAINYLRSLNANSLGAVTGMHIIEHIPFKRLIVFFDEVLRALKPGGVAIFESPNPENLLTASCNFYYDPTHLNPLPPEAMRFVLEIRGFSRIEIKRLHPYPEESRIKEGPEEVKKIINERFFGEQDYALVAYKL